MLKIITTYFILLILVVSGCTIEKRLYRKGWYISSRKEWRSDEAKEEATFKSKQSKIARQEASNSFTIDTNDLELDSVTNPEKDNLHELYNELPELQREIIAVKADAKKRKIAYSKAESVQEPGYERSKDARKVRIMLAFLIWFFLLMLSILLVSNPVSWTLFALWWFAGVFLILFIGLISIYSSNRPDLKLNWVEIKGDLLEKYKSGLRSKAVKLSVFTLVVGLVIFILAFPAYEVMLLFSCFIGMLLFVTLAAWYDHRKVKKTKTFYISEETAGDKTIGVGPNFRELTQDELAERRQLRLRRAIFMQVFMAVVLCFTLLIIIQTNPVTLIAFSVMMLFLVFFTFLIWFDFAQKNKYPERERITSKETFYRKLTPEETAEIKKTHLKKAIYFQVFFVVCFGLIFLILGTGSLSFNGILLLLLLFVYFSFVIWFNMIQRNKHPELEKEEDVPQVEIPEEPESEEEIDPAVAIASKMQKMKRLIIFNAFVAVALLLLAIIELNLFLWIFFGLFALGSLLTLLEFYRYKKRITTTVS